MPKKVDKNHSQVVKWFRQKGCDIDDVHIVPGFVDIVIGYRGLCAICEIKSDNKPLKGHQAEREATYAGLFRVIRDQEDVDTLLLDMAIMADLIAGIE